MGYTSEGESTIDIQSQQAATLHMITIRVIQSTKCLEYDVSSCCSNPYTFRLINESVFMSFCIRWYYWYGSALWVSAARRYPKVPVKLRKQYPFHDRHFKFMFLQVKMQHLYNRLSSWETLFSLSPISFSNIWLRVNYSHQTITTCGKWKPALNPWPRIHEASVMSPSQTFVSIRLQLHDAPIFFFSETSWTRSRFLRESSRVVFLQLCTFSWRDRLRERERKV